jgi:tRNA(fMet)-specific endonuclease VapC
MDLRPGQEPPRLTARPIPENDLWIAAIAIQHGLTLATRDEHFNDVDDLKRETGSSP